MKKKYRNFSVKQLLVIYLLFILVSLGTFIGLNVHSINQSKDSYLKTTEIQLNGLVNRFDLAAKAIQYNVFDLLQDKDLVNYRRILVGGSNIEKVNAQKNLLDRFKSAIGSSMYLGEIDAYWPKEKVLLHSQGSTIDNQEDFLKQINGIEKSGWYNFTPTSLYYINFNPLSTRNTPVNNYGFMILGKIQSSYLYSLIEETKINKNSSTFIMSNTKDETIPQNISSIAKKEAVQQVTQSNTKTSFSLPYRENNKSFTLLGKKSKNTHLWFFAIVSTEAYSAFNFQVLLPILFLLLILIGLATILFIFFYYNFYQNLNVLQNGFKESQKGNFEFQISRPAGREFYSLFTSYNKMNRQTHLLINRLQTEIHLKEEAEYRHLQAQINPHFLYNNFNFILSVAEKSPQTVMLMTHHLAEYYRYLTNKNVQGTTLIQELHWAENYLTIMSLRKNIDYFIDYPKEIENIPFMPLLLQPLVENAIYHGIEGRIGSSQVGIVVELKGDKIIISVMDDGKGLTEKEMKRLKQKIDSPKNEKESDGKIGLWNVNQRLMSHYGKEYTFQFKQGSIMGKDGLTVYFQIPNPLMKKGDDYK